LQFVESAGTAYIRCYEITLTRSSKEKTMLPQLPPTSDTSVWDTWMTMYQVPAVAVAIDLEIFDALHEQPDSPGGLAARMDFDERGLQALLPMLKHMGYLLHHDGLYSLSESGAHYMVSSSPFYWGGLFTRVGKTMGPYKLLRETINKDRINAEKNRPADGWESGHVDMELARIVTAFMHSHSVTAATGMTHTYDFSGTHRMLDVGGGSGCFSIALAQSRPDVSCTIMELPTICELALEYIRDAGVGGQVNTVVVDMFREKWPSGYDTHFFSNIFHDWSPATCLDIAKSSFSALTPGGRILLHEMLLDDDLVSPPHTVTFSLLMAMGTKGQQFSFPQLRDLLQEAGFTGVTWQPTYGYYSIVTGYKP
jgi:hypothetical protein